MSISKTYFDIITSESVVNISTHGRGDHNHEKIKVDGLLNIFLSISNNNIRSSMRRF
jgi:hypothetical protein